MAKEKKDKTVDERLADLEAAVNDISGWRRKVSENWKKFADRHLGAHDHTDGRLNSWVLVLTVIAGLLMATTANAEWVRVLGWDDDTLGEFDVESNNGGVSRLTVDQIASTSTVWNLSLNATNITAGNLDEARITNALAQSDINATNITTGNMVAGRITNALTSEGLYAAIATNISLKTALDAAITTNHYQTATNISLKTALDAAITTNHYQTVTNISIRADLDYAITTNITLTTANASATNRLTIIETAYTNAENLYTGNLAYQRVTNALAISGWTNAVSIAATNDIKNLQIWTNTVVPLTNSWVVAATDSTAATNDILRLVTWTNVVVAFTNDWTVGATNGSAAYNAQAYGLATFVYTNGGFGYSSVVSGAKGIITNVRYIGTAP